MSACLMCRGSREKERENRLDIAADLALKLLPSQALVSESLMDFCIFFPSPCPASSLVTMKKPCFMSFWSPP